MTNKVGIPVNGSNVSGPGEGTEIHIFEVENTKYKLVESYENPAIKATSTRGIHMLKSVLSKNVNAIIVSEIGAPGVNFLKNKIAYRVSQFLVAVHDPVARKPMTLVIGGIATILYIEFIFV